MCVSIAIDIGTTRVKAAILSEANRLSNIISKPAPALKTDGLRCEADPVAYLTAATSILDSIRSQVPEIPVGVASQRSSFLLWNKQTGRAETPVLCWQDRRAYDWCTSNQELQTRITDITGLLLSPHYVGPKLASLFTADIGLRRKAFAGDLKLGTLDSWLVWKWTHGRIHEVDLSMAARTLLVDLEKKRWSEELLSIFGVPQYLLPRITSTRGKRIVLDHGGVITATIADQAASVIPIIKKPGSNIMVNLGTGGFVIFPTGERLQRKPGYLSEPLTGCTASETQYALEGTINGIANALQQSANLPVGVSKIDPVPNCFCSPETAGIGAPYWMARVPFLLSESARTLKPPEQRRVVLEGIVFRICQILHDLCDDRFPPKIHIAGGISNENYICQGLAMCLNQPIYRSREKEMTLLGVAQLAANSPPNEWSSLRVETPRFSEHYLRQKYHEWRTWLDKEINGINGLLLENQE